MPDGHRWLVRPGTKLDLSEIDPESTPGAPGDRDATEAATADLNPKLALLQERLWAEREHALLVVLQAMDAGGKDGVIEHAFGAFNAQGTRVHSFKVPSEEEQAHDFLWRIHKVTPPKGEIAVFNRSHYEEVLVVRVHELVPESVWRPHYEHIEAFERGLAAAGTRIVKFFLHISKDEQARRFRDRLADPTKQWKFRAGDLDDRKKWRDFMDAYEEALTRTSTEQAPWYVIPADRKWYRNWAVSTILLEVLEDLDPRYPPLDVDPSSVVIR